LDATKIFSQERYERMFREQAEKLKGKGNGEVAANGD
jgi:hypothetical protein